MGEGDYFEFKATSYTNLKGNNRTNEVNLQNYFTELPNHVMLAFEESFIIRVAWINANPKRIPGRLEIQNESYSIPDFPKLFIHSLDTDLTTLLYISAQNNITLYESTLEVGISLVYNYGLQNLTTSTFNRTIIYEKSSGVLNRFQFTLRTTWYDGHVTFSQDEIWRVPQSQYFKVNGIMSYYLTILVGIVIVKKGRKLV